MPVQLAAQPQRRLFTVDDYYRMAAAGILAEDDSVELIEGEVIRTSPAGSDHASCVNRLTRLLTLRLGEQAIVAVQNPVHLDDQTELEPDLAVLRPREDFYAERHPIPEDILLLIEVSRSSLEFDHQVKLPLYARHGIPELWVVNLVDGVVEVHRDPKDGQYLARQDYRRGESLASLAMRDLELKVKEVLG